MFQQATLGHLHFPGSPTNFSPWPFICRAASTDLAACSSSTSSALRSLPAKASAEDPWHGTHGTGSSSRPQKSTDFGWVKRHIALDGGIGSEVLRPNLEALLALLFMLVLGDLEPCRIGRKKGKKTMINHQKSQYLPHLRRKNLGKTYKT